MLGGVGLQTACKERDELKEQLNAVDEELKKLG